MTTLETGPGELDLRDVGDGPEVAAARSPEPGGGGPHDVIPPDQDGDDALGEVPATGGADSDGVDERPPLADVLRPVLAAAFAASAAGVVAGGIFGSWGARATGVVGAFAGAGWALFALRSQRQTAVQAAFIPVAVLGAASSLVVRGASPGELATLLGEAIDSGRLFRPPVPYDPGWTPILLLLMAILGFAGGWVGAALARPKLAVALPLPIVGLTAITQPDDGQFIAGAGAFMCILAALAVLFGGDAERASDLGAQFEIKRAVRAVLLSVPVLLLLLAFNSASFLFPQPVYDPTDQPQRPRPIPLSAASDRVLFEVDTESGLTGPWRTGVLDVFEEDAWKLPPFDRSRLEGVPADGLISDVRAEDADLEVTITTRDLGDGSVLPGLGGATHFVGDAGGLVHDPRTGLIRVPTGRAPQDFTYTLRLPAYPRDDQLAAMPPADARTFAVELEAPPPPPVIRQLLLEAAPEPWARLDLLRQELLANVVAAGGGMPVDVPASRVAELFEDDARATPFEIVAAEALLARWAGVPSRIGFGFDGLNAEEGTFTVRPTNSAQWLEVWFDGFGWVPLIGAPDQAESTLDADPNARFDPAVEASDDVAVEVYVLYELDELGQLYERIRDQIMRWLPIILALALGWLVWPFFAKAHRRRKRRRWAQRAGARAQIAVEYAELRDLATDLNVADTYSTPLEYVFEVKDDEEHAELAWLVGRSLYGDLALTVGPEDVRAAETMSASVRRRLLRAQPLQSRLLALVSRASIKEPYSREVPNIVIPRRPKIRIPTIPARRMRLAVATAAGRNR